MISDDKISKLIATMIVETRRGNIKWDFFSNKKKVALEGEQRLLGKAYILEYKQKLFQLFKYEETIQEDEFEFRDRVFYKLVIIDSDLEPLWEFPHYTRELRDLYEIVSYQLANIDILFDDNESPEINI